MNSSTPKKKAPRQSNIELLRILALFFITSHHYYDKRKGDFAEIMRPGYTASNIFLQTIYGLGNIGVNIFVMISGYFSYRSGYSARKVLQLIIQQEFYAIGILLVLGISKIVPFTAVSVYRHLLSVAYNSDYWFGYAFIGLMLVGDYVNVVLKGLDKDTFRWGIISVGLYYCLLPTINNSGNSFWGVDATSWFVYMYVIGAYIRLHEEPLFSKKYRWLMLLIFVLTHAFTSLMTIAYSLWPDNDYSGFYKLNLDKRDRITCLVSSTSLFVFFTHIDVGSISIINIISSCMFSVYLLQENEQMRDVWWRMVFDVVKYYQPFWRLLLQYVWAIATIFVLAIVIDLLRQYLFEKPLFMFIDWMIGKWDENRKSKGKREEEEGGEGKKKEGEEKVGGGKEEKEDAIGYSNQGSINDESTPLRGAGEEEEGGLDAPLLSDQGNVTIQDQM